MKKYIPVAFVSGIFMMVPAIILAQVVAPVAPPIDVPPDQFLEQVFQVVKSLGGLSWMLKISAICLLLVSSMKVSFLNNLIWNRLGAWQKLVAPVFALVGGLLAYIGGVGVKPSLASVVAYLFAGGGALALHELLDGAKAIPGIGPVYVSVIDLISKLLGGSSSGGPGGSIASS